MPTDFKHTKAAAVIYRAGEGVRRDALDTADSDEDFVAYIALIEHDADLLRSAFFKDTSMVNSWDKVKALCPYEILKYVK